MLGKPLVSVAEALAAIGRELSPLPTLRVTLASAAGLTLSRPIRTDIDYPPFDKATMDGFAVRSEDCRGPGTSLEIIGAVAAGHAPTRAVASGQAMRISTGAPLPIGADSVIMVEDTVTSTDGKWVVTARRPQAGANILQRGREVQAGQIVLDAGIRLGPAQLAAAAAAGAADVEVYRRPRVAVLVTGDELVPPEQAPGAGQIRDANGPCLLALARQAGCEPIDLGSAADTREALAAKLREVLSSPSGMSSPPGISSPPYQGGAWGGLPPYESPAPAASPTSHSRGGLRRPPDIICISGGVSMGPHDHVPDTLLDLGVRLIVRKVAIKPGKPLVVGLAPTGQLVFGLPGNPVSSFVTFLVFVRAAIAGLQGRAVEFPPTLAATLAAPLPTAGDRAEFVPARLAATRDGHWQATPVRWQGSGDIFAMAAATGLLLRDPDAPAAPAGSTLPAIPLSFAW